MNDIANLLQNDPLVFIAWAIAAVSLVLLFLFAIYFNFIPAKIAREYREIRERPLLYFGLLVLVMGLALITIVLGLPSGFFVKLIQDTVFVVGFFTVAVVVLALIFLTPAIRSHLRSNKGVTAVSAKSSLGKIQKHWIKLAVLAVLLLVVGCGLLFLYVRNTSVLILSARHFLLLERSGVELLKSGASYAEIYEKGDLLLFDARDINSYFKARAQGATVINLDELLKAEELNYPKDKRVALYGSSDQLDQLRKAADKLQRSGVPKVYIIKDGLEGFRKAGYPIIENAPITLRFGLVGI